MKDCFEMMSYFLACGWHRAQYYYYYAGSRIVYWRVHETARTYYGLLGVERNKYINVI
jgi:hypothetical protein